MLHLITSLTRCSPSDHDSKRDAPIDHESKTKLPLTTRPTRCSVNEKASDEADAMTRDDVTKERLEFLSKAAPCTRVHGGPQNGVAITHWTCSIGLWVRICHSVIGIPVLHISTNVPRATLQCPTKHVGCPSGFITKRFHRSVLDLEPEVTLLFWVLVRFSGQRFFSRDFSPLAICEFQK